MWGNRELSVVLECRPMNGRTWQRVEEEGGTRVVLAEPRMRA